MGTMIKRLGKGTLLCSLGWAIAAPAAAAGLREAVEQAWRAQPEAAAQPARQAELAARQRAAAALTPEAPSVSVAHKTDQLGRDLGQREWEAELGVPLWLPGQRDRQQASIAAEHAAYTQALSTAQWRVAGEVREAYWAVRLADNDRLLAARKVDDAELLTADVERRVRAGDLPSVDLNQARVSVQQALLARAQADAAFNRARQHFAALTDGAQLPTEEEPAAASEDEALMRHPLLLSLQADVRTRRSRLAETAGKRRDNPELALAVGRERDNRLDAYGNTLTLRLRLPFASATRNQSALEAANAELAEAEARLSREMRNVSAEIHAARAERHAADQAVLLAEARQRLSQASHAWLSKAFRLGELDLAARLRAEAERFDADLNLSRAKLEAARARSRLNHALGVLP